MVSRPTLFNIILLPLLVLAFLPGCKTTPKPERERAKQLATLRVFMETKGALGNGEAVSICRSSPIEVFVGSEPFLSEAHIESASVLTNHGGHSIVITLNKQGGWLLEQYTSGNPGKRLAIRAQFGKDLALDRWLAAPLPSQPIRSGKLAFTPDADADETEQIVIGLNNAAK